MAKSQEPNSNPMAKIDPLTSASIAPHSTYLPPKVRNHSPTPKDNAPEPKTPKSGPKAKPKALSYAQRKRAQRRAEGREGRWYHLVGDGRLPGQSIFRIGSGVWKKKRYKEGHEDKYPNVKNIKPEIKKGERFYVHKVSGNIRDRFHKPYTNCTCSETVCTC